MDKSYFLIEYNKCFGDVDDPGYRVVNKESVLPGIDPLSVEIGQVVSFFGFDSHPFITAKVLKTSDREVELHKALSQIILKKEGKKRRRSSKNLEKGKENVDTDIMQMVLDIDEAMQVLQETSDALEKSMKTFQETHDLVKRVNYDTVKSIEFENLSNVYPQKTGRIKFLHSQQNKLSRNLSRTCACSKYPAITGLPPGFEIVYRGTNTSNPQNSKKRKLNDCEDESDCSIDMENESETDSTLQQNDEVAKEDQNEPYLGEKLATELVETINSTPIITENPMEEKKKEALVLADENLLDKIYEENISTGAKSPPKTKPTVPRKARTSAEQMLIDDNASKDEIEPNLSHKKTLRKRVGLTENNSPDAQKKPRTLTGIIKKSSSYPKTNGETETSVSIEAEKKVSFMLDSEYVEPEQKKVNARKTLYRKTTRRNPLNSEGENESSKVESSSNCDTQETTLVTDVKGRKILRRDGGVASDSVEIILQGTEDKKTSERGICESFSPSSTALKDISSDSLTVVNSPLSTILSKMKELSEVEKESGICGNTKIMFEDSVELEFIRSQSTNGNIDTNANIEKVCAVFSENNNVSPDKPDEQKDSTPEVSEENSTPAESFNINDSTIENDDVTSTNVDNADDSLPSTKDDDSIRFDTDVNSSATNDNDASLSEVDKNSDANKSFDVEENYVKPVNLLPEEILNLPNATEILNDKSSYVKIKPSELSVKTYENKDTYSWTLKFSGPIEDKTVQILNGLNIYLAKESLLAATAASNLDDLCKILLESIFNIDALKECGLLRHKAKGIKYRLHPRALNSIIIFAKLVAKIKQWDVDVSDRAITNSIRFKLKQIQQT